MDQLFEKIEALTSRLQELARQQSQHQKQMIELMDELAALKQQVAGKAIQPTQTTAQEKTVPVKEAVVATSPVIQQPGIPDRKHIVPKSEAKSPAKQFSFEEFIGKNLASKVGILVTIVGIFIGARYALEHQLVSPAVRVITGYISGLLLAGLAIRLKNKYENYSAVLMGGGLSVLYFITYIAYGYYNMLPQIMAFLLMFVFTAAIVYAALLYNKVIIAHLAQVGAYAIPFMLSDNSGRYSVLFTYIAIINAGILVLSFWKYWKSLLYVAFFSTWTIFLVWYIMEYSFESHINLAWTFSIIYFILFYAAVLAYKMVKKEQYNAWDVVLLMWNSFVFYGTGMILLAANKATAGWQGVFTIANAAVHYGVSQLISQLKLADRRLYYLVFGLALIFFTISFPVQFDGNWVTMFWTLEAVLVFTIGRRRGASAYEKLGAGLILLGFFSLLHDWSHHLPAFTGPNNQHLRPFLNITFFTGILVLLAYAYIIWLDRNKKYPTPTRGWATVYALFYDYAVPVLCLASAYFAFLLEVQGYFIKVSHQFHGADGSFGPWGSEVSLFNIVTLLLYSMVFTALVIFINQQWVRNKSLAMASLAAIALLVVILLISGLPLMNEMAAHYFEKDGAGLYFGKMNLLVRYLAMGVVALLVLLGCRIVKDFIVDDLLKKAWWLMVYTIIVSFTSFEYLHWMRVSGAGNQYKLGLSILWGLFALGFIVYGIWKKLRYVRLGAIVLLVITLIKLFVYDLAEAGTVTKTVSFISLGAILLLVSYLYNRYKDILFGPDEGPVSNKSNESV